MTHQASKLLRLLIRVQKRESNLIIIDPQKFCATTANVVGTETTTVKLEEFKTSLWPTLQYLVDENKISLTNPANYHLIQVNHNGWYFFKTRSRRLAFGIIRFILCSIVIPIIVATVTTLITLNLN